MLSFFCMVIPASFLTRKILNYLRKQRLGEVQFLGVHYRLSSCVTNGIMLTIATCNNILVAPSHESRKHFPAFLVMQILV